MFTKLFNISSPEKVLELENLEKMLQVNLPEIKPRSGYKVNLRRRLSDYTRTVPVVYPKSRARFNPTTNDALLMLIGILSGAAVLVMGIRVAIVTIAGLGIMRNLKRDIQTDRWQSPRPAG